MASESSKHTSGYRNQRLELKRYIMQVYVLSQRDYDNSHQDYEWDWSSWQVIGVTTSHKIALKWGNGECQSFSRHIDHIVEDEEGKEYLILAPDEGSWPCGGSIKFQRKWELFELDAPVDTSRDG
jgi:hypothetical protein